MNLQYINASEVIREVKNELSGYFERGILDDSYLYPAIRECLSDMGLKILPMKKDVLKVENNVVDLPCDFYKMVGAIGCGTFQEFDIDYTNSHLVEYEVSGSNTCECIEYCEDACGLFGIKQTFNTYSVEWTDLFPIRVSGDAKPYCVEDCFKYKQCKEEITIKNGKIYTNFNGSIYIEYLTNLENEDGDLMVPDHEKIKAWIKDKLFFVCFRVLWRNGDGDVERRYQDAKQQLAISQVNASNLYKAWTVKDYYDLRKVLYSRFHKYNTVVYGKGYNGVPYSNNKRF